MLDCNFCFLWSMDLVLRPKYKWEKWLTERFWFRVGVEHVGGDMFESVPEGDAIFMKVAFAFLALIYHLYIS